MFLRRTVQEGELEARNQNAQKKQIFKNVPIYILRDVDTDTDIIRT